MKLSQTLNSSLNQQILHELRNANIYSQIESYFEDLQLKNLALYFRNQSLQEKSHADKFIQYINSRTGGKVAIGEVNSPSLSLNSVEDVADAIILTEENTTESIEALMDLVLEGKSYIDMGFIESMLNEQCEEEDWANELGLKLKMCKDIVLFDNTFEVGD